MFPAAHPLWAGMLMPAAAGIRATLAPYERVFLVGGRAFMVYPYSDGSPLPDGTDLVQLSPDPSAFGPHLRRHPRRGGRPGADPERRCCPSSRRRPTRAAAADAVAAGRPGAPPRRRSSRRPRRERYGPAPMDPMAVSHALVRAMPADCAVVDEAITTGVYVRGFHHWTEPGRYYFCKGGGLGWGMPASLGVSLAHGKQLPVLCVVGDGSAMYSPQALWTAAHEQLPVVFAVVNNRQYLILKNNLRIMKGEAAATGRYVAMDIVDPPVDYVGLAASLGVGLVADRPRRRRRRRRPRRARPPARRTSSSCPSPRPPDGRRRARPARA